MVHIALPVDEQNAQRIKLSSSSSPASSSQYPRCTEYCLPISDSIPTILTTRRPMPTANLRCIVIVAGNFNHHEIGICACTLYGGARRWNRFNDVVALVMQLHSIGPTLAIEHFAAFCLVSKTFCGRNILSDAQFVAQASVCRITCSQRNGIETWMWNHSSSDFMIRQ